MTDTPHEEQASNETPQDEESPLPGPPAVRLPETKRKKSKDRQKNGSSGVLTARKPKQPALLHVTVWPEGAGEPYGCDVEVQDDGWFYLDKKQVGPRYRVRSGTVVYEDGKYRAIVREGVFETVDVRDLELGPHPEEMDGLLVGDILERLRGKVRRRQTLRTAAEVGKSIALLGILGVLIWGVVAIGGDLSGLREAVDGVAQALQGGGGGGSGAAAGHQPISPGGN